MSIDKMTLPINRHFDCMKKCQRNGWFCAGGCDMLKPESLSAAMTHATETPERNLAPEPNEQGFRYILNWMKFILEKPCDRTADESFITEWCDFVYQCQSRLAAAEEDVAERDRWLYASKVRENDYHERWLHNLDRATGMASKWGDLENRVFAAEQRADAAESALQSAWGGGRGRRRKNCCVKGLTFMLSVADQHAQHVGTKQPIF